MAEEQKPKHPGGRPPKFPPTPENLQQIDERTEEYFETCLKGEEVEIVTKRGDKVTITKSIPPTTTGLALALGFNGRKQLIEYSEREEFRPTLARAFARIEKDRVEGALMGKYDPNMSKLDLTHNFKWIDKVSLAGDDGGPLLPGVMGDTERSARLLFLLEQAEKRSKGGKS